MSSVRSVLWCLFVGLLLSALGCSQTLVAKVPWTAPYWARRAVVFDDFVYVRSNQTLYKRYLPKYSGMYLPGNPALLKAAGGRITKKNPNIIVFCNYSAAVASGIGFKLDPASQPYIDKLQARQVRSLKRLSQNGAASREER